uniref:Uncharacterized protein n=1 Tax=Rhizophora mucronata TaxID=61149 RepID=A0A2P2Q3L6_RHIMU
MSNDRLSQMTSSFYFGYFCFSIARFNIHNCCFPNKSYEEDCKFTGSFSHSPYLQLLFCLSGYIKFSIVPLKQVLSYIHTMLLSLSLLQLESSCFSLFLS